MDDSGEQRTVQEILQEVRERTHPAGEKKTLEEIMREQEEQAKHLCPATGTEVGFFPETDRIGCPECGAIVSVESDHKRTWVLTHPRREP